MSKPRLKSIYNWYHPDVKTGDAAQSRGILGWTKEESIAGGSPQGKPIFAGIENNTHLNSSDHQDAMTTLQNRADRIQEAIRYKKIKPEHLSVAQNELDLIQKQKAGHEQEAKKTQNPAPQPALGKSQRSSSLNRLLRIYRERTALGK